MRIEFHATGHWRPIGYMELVPRTLSKLFDVELLPVTKYCAPDMGTEETDSSLRVMGPDQSFGVKPFPVKSPS